MNASSLESKTIRPGSLSSYSYYHSARRPASPQRPAYIAAKSTSLIPYRQLTKVVVVVVLVVGIGVGGSLLQSKATSPVAKATSPVTKATSPASNTGNISPVATKSAPAVLSATSSNRCRNNTDDKLIIIDVSERLMWACEHDKTMHKSSVITGMLSHESTLTPPGTYEIYAKVTDTTLSGKDETGDWNVPVYYWMPFLDNQHGTYGFHDATWRPDKEFGKVDPNSDDASHGCVELPLASSKWLYEWASIGTKVTVES